MILKNMNTEYGVSVTLFRVARFDLQPLQKKALIDIYGFATPEADKPLNSLTINIANYSQMESRIEEHEDGSRHQFDELVAHNDYDEFKAALDQAASWEIACEEYIISLPEFAGATRV